MKRVSLLLLFVFLLGSLTPARAQEAPPKYEFRGAWIATVVNLDWPGRTWTPAQQREALVRMLNELKAAGVNAVIFQVRPEADALYPSEIEPWSYWLTNAQGSPPNPMWDPLAFAIEEAHKRGMELHAWFNPYRAVRSIGTYDVHDSHVSKTHPEWILTFNNRLKLLDPGLQEVRDYNTSVIMDVVRRYDIDGVHFDDYFYPYPPDAVSNEDQATFAAHNRGFTDIRAWRRDNINLFVEQIADSIDAVKPEVKFGISPFGIWKSGVPQGIVGLSAYDTIYADALAWLDADWIDYITPQLYWAFGGGQDYGKLAPWWASVVGDRHLYPGSIFRDTYTPGEVPRQVRFNRNHAGIQGSVLFRATHLENNYKGISDTLATDLFRYPALTPSMAWKSLAMPGAPENLDHAWTGDTEVTLSWQPPASGDAEARLYAVYRTRSGPVPDWQAVMADPRNLLALTGQTSFRDRPGISPLPYYYAVTAVSANSIESAPSNHTLLLGRATSVEDAETPEGFRLGQNYPNPFNPTTEIGFVLDAPATARLDVYDVLGRRVATLLDGISLAAGPHAARWDGRDENGAALPSGTYFYALEVGGRRATRAMLLVK